MIELPLPGVIPYVEFHTGPCRVLTLNLTSGNTVAISRHRPIVSIDGRQYLVIWGAVSFEVPADRNVHVSIHIEADYITQVASMLLPPNPQDQAFRYETHYASGLGALSEQA